jgi:hypothetical protein
MFTDFIAILALDGLTGAQRRSALEQMIVSAIPGSSSQRLAFAAITAEQQVRRASLQDRNLIEEVVKVAQVPSAEVLQQRFPQLHARFTALPPELQAQIVFPPPEPGEEDGAKRGGDKGPQPADYGAKTSQQTQAH